MHVMAINASPRKNGNTSTLIQAVLEGAQQVGAETSQAHPAAGNEALLEKARGVGRKLAGSPAV